MNQSIANKKIVHLSPSAFPAGGLFLHAAAVLTPGGVILLMGHSTSGKTTLCSMLSSYFPVVADDIIYAFRRESGAWAVMDGDLIKSEILGNKNFPADKFQKMQSYPLQSVLRIFAAHRTKLKTLPSIKICEYLMDAVFEIDVQRKIISSNLIIRWFHLSAALARQCAGWQLMFTLDEKEVLSVFQNTLFDRQTQKTKTRVEY